MMKYLNFLPGFNRQKEVDFTKPTPSGNGTSTDRTLIDLRKVVKTYQTPAGDFTALRNIDLQVKAGEFVAVIGKSGSGKSTLINMLTGIDRPTAGEVIIGEVPIHNLNENQMARWRKLNLGVIFQFFQLLPTLTVLENIVLPMELGHVFSANEREERALHLLERVGLIDQAHKFPSAISGGQQQRVAIARSLANDPDVLVADEPTGSLDSKTSDEVFELFENFVGQGKTLLMVTHDRELASRVPRIVFIADGEITDQQVAKALPTLTKKELAHISAKLEPINYAPGEMIIKQGDPADSLYIIVKGNADVFVHHDDDKDLIIGHLTSGQYFGETGLLRGVPRSATVKAASNSEVIVMQLDRETFMELVENSDKSKEDFLYLMRQRVMTSHIAEALPPFDQSKLDALIDYEQANKRFKRGEIIFRYGDVADYLYVIVKGYVEVINHRPNQEDIVVARLGSGQYFGEVGLIRKGVRMATVRAATNTELIAVDRDALMTLMDDSKLTITEASSLLSYHKQKLSALFKVIDIDEYLKNEAKQ